MIKDRLSKRIKITSEVLSKIAKIDEFKGLWHGGVKLSPQILGRLRASVIITSSGASTRIEGSKMNDQEIARFLRGLKTKPPSDRDEQEVAGYADLLGRIFDHYTSLKLSENNILFFHQILLKFSEKDKNHLGKYKTQANTVIAKNETGKVFVLFNPTPPYLVKVEIDNVIDWVNKELLRGEIHPLLVIANFVFEFLAIHPFLDGNGRLSRAITNLLLLRAGYSYGPYVSLDEIIEENKTDYYLSLRATQKKHKTKNEDLTPWLIFFLDVLLRQTARAKKLMNQEQPEKLLSENQMEILKNFDDDELLSVSELIEKIKSIPRPTIKQSLTRLVALGLLESVGRGRGVRYKKYLN